MNFAHHLHRPRSAGRAVANYPLKIEAAYGRLYVSGSAARIVQGIKGAYHSPASDKRPESYQLSLTLESLRAIRAAGGFTSEQLARYCSPSVMAWAHAAHKSDKAVGELHKRIAQGFRMELPWMDNGREAAVRRAPFEHQRVMATVACCLDGAAFLCEMGTGKTRAAIAAAEHHIKNNTLDFVIVVAPANVLETWRREVSQWSSLRAHVLEGYVRDREALLKHIAEDRQGIGAKAVVILNYEVLHRMRDTIEALARRYRVGFIPDEMHRLRNPSAKMTKAAMGIAAAMTWRLGMTGSPVINGIEDVWSQWYLIDLGVAFGANFVQFRREFFEQNPWTPHTLSPLDDTAHSVGVRLRKRGLRYRKSDCLDLPPKLYEVRQCDMTAEQSRAYVDMANQLVVALRDLEADTTRVATAAIVLTMMLRLSQITSGFLPLNPESESEDERRTRHIFDPNPKLALLDDIVEECMAQGQQIIVWARYRYDVEAIARRYSRWGTAMYYGGTSKQERIEAENDFQAGRKRILVANPASGGMGLTLTAASTAVYYSQSFSLEHRIQSEDRNHRAGSERHASITYIDLVCSGSIDETVRAALASKLETAQAVVELRQHIEQAAGV